MKKKLSTILSHAPIVLQGFARILVFNCDFRSRYQKLGMNLERAFIHGYFYK